MVMHQIDFVAECDKFEKGVGVIMKNAWQHVEVLQTTDLPALLHHIAFVLEGAVAMPEVLEALLKKNDAHQRQEVLVFHYLHDVLRHVEDIQEHRVMPLLRELGIFMLTVRALMAYGSELHVSHRLAAAKALALLVETEDFSTHREAYYSSSAHSGDLDRLLQFKESFLGDLLSGEQQLERRKAVRPLLDCIDRAKRLGRTK